VLCTLLALGLLALAGSTLAQATARVVLVTGHEPVLARKVRAEAEAVGLRVVEIASDAGAAELMARHDATAVIRLASADRAEVAVGLADGAISRTLTRRPTDGDSFALRVVEEVYARLVELRVIEPRSDSTAPPSQSAGGTREASPGSEPVETRRDPSPVSTPGSSHPGQPPAPADRRPDQPRTGAEARLFLSGGLGISQPAGGVSGSLHGAIGVRLEPARRFAAAAHAFLPLTENNLSEPEGSADVNVNLFLGQIEYALLAPARTLELNAGLGAGVVVLAMHGEAEQPRTGQEQRTIAGVYFLNSSLAWSLTPWFRLRATVLGGLSAPRPVLRFENRPVASWGRPFAAAALTSEFGLPLSGSGGSP
jgi:hypothetical protein